MDEDEPPAPSAFLEAFSSTTPGLGSSPPRLADPDELAWALRAAGADEEAVTEALERLADGPDAMYAWLQGQRRIGPPVCQVCGLQLVSPGWRGSDTVGCDRCGTTWRVTVTSADSHGVSGVAGPSREWLADHPENDRFTVDAIDVVTGELPPLLDDPEPDIYFPVARWRSGPQAAVLFLRRVPEELVEVEGGRWEEQVVFLEQVADGWEEVYAEASASFLDPLDPVDGFFERFGAWLGELHCDSDESDPDALWLLGGRVGPRVARIVAVTDQGVESFEVHPPTRFFLVALTGAGWFRFLDAEGSVITIHGGWRLEIPTHD